MELEKIKELVACCACREPMGGSQHCNLVAVGRRATWDYPCSANVLTGRDHEALGVVCDPCLEGRREILVAVEFRGQYGEEIVYHPVADLELMPPEKTYRMLKSRSGIAAIECLICGSVSFHPDDIKQKYCGHCHQFHVTDGD